MRVNAEWGSREGPPLSHVRPIFRYIPEERYLPTSYMEWLERRASGSADRQTYLDAVATCQGKRPQDWSSVWELFERYSEEVRQENPAENLTNPPPEAEQDILRWTPSSMRTCYLGDTIILTDDKGEQYKKMTPGLAPHEPWERALDPDYRVTDTTVEERVALDEANLARGDKNKVTPEHEPHRYVDMTKGSDMLFANRRDKGFGFTCERGPTLDPVLRLFLRWDTVESGSEVDIGGIKGRMDWQERQALNHNSVAESARLMRASLNLHYAHHFTHCASVDGSKAR